MEIPSSILCILGGYCRNPHLFTQMVRRRWQTEIAFQALKGLGAPVRMVILPKESHGYAAKESIMHLLWEQDQFLEKCLKK
ncbi:alpha/beta hydrolase family protein [Undibacterium sp. Ji83W]|uniref:alpha/beta hydrolase family protein n=1 Tax=Undibacterium sp. Ji83W TaxID=3413043 RepID=UPI003BF22249